MHEHTNQAAYNNGRVRLYLFSARRVELEGDGSRICLLHRVEACPSSRCVLSWVLFLIGWLMDGWMDWLVGWLLFLVGWLMDGCMDGLID